MDYLSFLAPIAFVFALSAISQVSSLKKEVQRLSDKIERLDK